jgi:hypothetical protein
MKKTLLLLLLLSVAAYSQVGIGTNTPHTSAQLELSSTTRGFLPPRMTQTQRNAIPSPVAGLIVYCTNCGASGEMQVYNGTVWTNATGGAEAPPLASLASLNCADATNNGVLLPNTLASGVSTTIAYTGGNGGTYPEQTVTSTGVTGLTATLVAGAIATGNGTITFTISGTPSSSGTASFVISLGGQSCTLTIPVGILDRAYGQTIYGANNHNFIYLPVTGADGKTWLNNNLGADYANVSHPSFNPSQQATSETDHLAYGSLFQWGRSADGHELINWVSSTSATAVNGTTATRPDADTSANALFITINSGNFDWRGSIQNDALWQGVSGTNNPCPVGYRLPTLAELTTLVTTSSITNSATAASSAMKFTVPGRRFNGSGSLNILGSFGYYWSSSVSGTGASFRRFYSGGTDTFDFGRAYGLTVRCLKE